MKKLNFKPEDNESEFEQREDSDSERVIDFDVKRKNTEVVEKPKRRTHTIAYKLKILKEIEEANESGEIGSILRREGLYSSTVSGWRRQREEGRLDLNNPVKRGRKKRVADSRDKVIKQLERENKKLKKDLARVKVVNEIQKKMAELMELESQEKEDRN